MDVLIEIETTDMRRKKNLPEVDGFNTDLESLVISAFHGKASLGCAWLQI